MKQKPNQDWQAVRQAVRELNETMDRVEMQLVGRDPDSELEQLFYRLKTKKATP